MAISDDPLDNIIRPRVTIKNTFSNITLKEKLAVITSAREFARDYDLNVVPNFIDDLVSTVFPDYIIYGTYLEQLNMRDEWKDMISSGGWNSKQYLHYLVNMYATG